ncbi:MAG: anti-sigma factor family protein [Planctomycetales bacterium]
MAKITRLSAEQRENLTAYLDGELDEPGTQQVEQILAESVVARHEVDMLSRTWDLLGVLPGVKASEEFTRKTLSSIRAAEIPQQRFDSRHAARQMRRALVLALWGIVLVASGFLGYRATTHWLPNESEQLLDEFDVIANLQDYSEVGDIEFLRILKAKRTLAEHNDASRN